MVGHCLKINDFPRQVQAKRWELFDLLGLKRYYCMLMSRDTQLPDRQGPHQTQQTDEALVLDVLEFARRNEVLERRFALSSLSRLADVLVRHEGDLTLHMQGGRDREGNWLKLEITGDLVLRCQRCLGELPWHLAVFANLRLIPPGAQWPDEDLAEDEWDPIEASEDFNVTELVEEEVLLALPLAARHEKCEAPAGADDKSAASPFAALAAIKRNQGSI